MNEKFITIFWKPLAKSLFTLTAFVFLVQAESAQYAPADFCYYTNPTKIELIYSAEKEVGFSAGKIECASKFITKSLTTHQELLSLFKTAQLHFDQYILAQYKSLQDSFIPDHHLTRILHKKNTWHRSSDDTHFLFV